ncbi:MAG: transglutaminase N-terminal domain-containing protein [Acidimicrobiia bacterium]
MTRYLVHHGTRFRYERPLTGQLLAHLLPRDTPTQQVVRSEITVDPAPDERTDHVDAFGNDATYLALRQPHSELHVVATSEIVVTASRWPHQPATAWDLVVAGLHERHDSEAIVARWCTLDSPLVAATAALRDYALPSFPVGRPLDEALTDLCHRIFTDFAFDPSATDVGTPLDIVLASRRGVCQDFAHLGIGCLRAMGLPARYVSGYLETEPPEGQPRMIGADASHAWIASYLPDFGWIDFDPTNDNAPTRKTITVAWGRDYRDVAPLRGMLRGPATTQQLDVSVDVQPLT